MVLAVFENRRINERVKAYKLNTQFKCGPIKVREGQCFSFGSCQFSSPSVDPAAARSLFSGLAASVRACLLQGGRALPSADVL